MKHTIKNKMVALSVAIIFTMTPVAPAPAFAVEQSPVSSLINSGIGTLFQDFNAMDLPVDTGKIQETYRGSGAKVAILIQDAHSIPEAQKSIQKTITFFQKKYGVGLVALEGASGRYDPQIFKSFPDQKNLRSVFKDYLNAGELTGGTASAVFNGSESIYHGMENWDLYQEGVGYFLQALNAEEEVLSGLHRSVAELQNEKERLYSKELLEADRFVNDFKNNKIDLLKILRKLAAIQAPSQGSELALLVQQAGQREDPALLDIETRQLADTVKKALNARLPDQRVTEDLKLFNERYQAWRVSQIKAQDLTLLLKELAAKYNLRLKVSRKLDLMTSDQKRMRDIEGTAFFRDFENYEQGVFRSLLKNEEQRILYRQSRMLDLLERLALLKLDQEDWKKIKKMEASLNESNVIRDSIAGETQVARFLKIMEPNIRFYETAEKRDHELCRRVLDLMKHYKSASSIVVAGGFHTEGLTALLKSKGISYVLVMPAIDQLPEDNHYRGHMRGEVSWSDYFRVENGKVNLYDAFVRGTRDKLLAESVERGADSLSTLSAKRYTLKNWRDQIIRDLAARGEISKAGQYTRFIDEMSQTSSLSPQTLLNKWLKNIDVFGDGLKKLEGAGRLDEQSILGLVKSITSAELSLANGLVRDAVTVDSLLPVLGNRALALSPSVKPELRVTAAIEAFVEAANNGELPGMQKAAQSVLALAQESPNEFSADNFQTLIRMIETHWDDPDILTVLDEFFEKLSADQNLMARVNEANIEKIIWPDHPGNTLLFEEGQDLFEFNQGLPAEGIHSAQAQQELRGIIGDITESQARTRRLNIYRNLFNGIMSNPANYDKFTNRHAQMLIHRFIREHEGLGFIAAVSKTPAVNVLAQVKVRAKQQSVRVLDALALAIDDLDVEQLARTARSADASEESRIKLAASMKDAFNDVMVFRTLAGTALQEQFGSFHTSSVLRLYLLTLPLKQWDQKTQRRVSLSSPNGELASELMRFESAYRETLFETVSFSMGKPSALKYDEETESRMRVQRLNVLNGLLRFYSRQLTFEDSAELQDHLYLSYGDNQVSQNRPLPIENIENFIASMTDAMSAGLTKERTGEAIRALLKEYREKAMAGQQFSVEDLRTVNVTLAPVGFQLVLEEHTLQLQDVAGKTVFTAAQKTLPSESPKSELRQQSFGNMLERVRDRSGAVSERLQALNDLEVSFTDRTYAGLFPWQDLFHWADAGKLVPVLEELQDPSQDEQIREKASSVRQSIIAKMGPVLSSDDELDFLTDQQVTIEIFHVANWYHLWNLPLSLDQIRPYAKGLLRYASMQFSKTASPVYGWFNGWEIKGLDDDGDLENFLTGFALVDASHRESALRLLRGYLAHADAETDDHIIGLLRNHLEDPRAFNFPAPTEAETAKKEAEWEVMPDAERTAQSGLSMVFNNLIGAGPYNIFDLLSEKYSEKRFELVQALAADAERDALERQTHEHTAFEDQPFPHVHWDNVRKEKVLAALDKLERSELRAERSEMRGGWLNWFRLNKKAFVTREELSSEIEIGQPENVKISNQKKSGNAIFRDFEEDEIDFIRVPVNIGTLRFFVHVLQNDFAGRSEADHRQIIRNLMLGLQQAMERFYDIGGEIPAGEFFEIYYGATNNKGNLPHAIHDRHSLKFYAGSIPYGFNRNHDLETMGHELGHLLYALMLGKDSHSGTRNIALEEGIANYIGGSMTLSTPDSEGRAANPYRYSVHPDTLATMSGFLQLDVETVLGGDTDPLAGNRKYRGSTHHIFGDYFLMTFVEVFGVDPLWDFLRMLQENLNATEDEFRAALDAGTAQNFGSEFVPDILRQLGYGEGEIKRFEDVLHRKLKQNLFGFTGEPLAGGNAAIANSRYDAGWVSTLLQPFLNSPEWTPDFFNEQLTDPDGQLLHYLFRHGVSLVHSSNLEALRDQFERMYYGGPQFGASREEAAFVRKQQQKIKKRIDKSNPSGFKRGLEAVYARQEVQDLTGLIRLINGILETHQEFSRKQLLKNEKESADTWIADLVEIKEILLKGKNDLQKSRREQAVKAKDAFVQKIRGFPDSIEYVFLDSENWSKRLRTLKEHTIASARAVSTEEELETLADKFLEAIKVFSRELHRAANAAAGEYVLPSQIRGLAEIENKSNSLSLRISWQPLGSLFGAGAIPTMEWKIRDLSFRHIGEISAAGPGMTFGGKSGSSSASVPTGNSSSISNAGQLVLSSESRGQSPWGTGQQARPEMRTIGSVSTGLENINTLVLKKFQELDFFNLDRPVTEEHLLELQKVIADQEDFDDGIHEGKTWVLPRERGKFRDENLGRYASTPGNLVESELRDLFQWLSGEETSLSEANAEETAAEFFIRYIAIHPFYDVNGRVGRQFLNLLLVRYGRPAIKLDLINWRSGAFVKEMMPGDVEFFAALIRLAQQGESTTSIYRYGDKSDNPALIDVRQKDEKIPANRLLNWLRDHMRDPQPGRRYAELYYRVDSSERTDEFDAEFNALLDLILSRTPKLNRGVPEEIANAKRWVSSFETYQADIARIEDMSLMQQQRIAKKREERLRAEEKQRQERQRRRQKIKQIVIAFSMGFVFAAVIAVKDLIFSWMTEKEFSVEPAGRVTHTIPGEAARKSELRLNADALRLQEPFGNRSLAPNEQVLRSAAKEAASARRSELRAETAEQKITESRTKTLQAKADMELLEALYFDRAKREAQPVEWQSRVTKQLETAGASVSNAHESWMDLERDFNPDYLQTEEMEANLKSLMALFDRHRLIEEQVFAIARQNYAADSGIDLSAPSDNGINLEKPELRMSLFATDAAVNSWFDGLEAQGVYGAQRVTNLEQLFQKASSVFKHLTGREPENFEELLKEAVEVNNSYFREQKRISAFEEKLKEAEIFYERNDYDSYSQTILNALLELPVFYDEQGNQVTMEQWLQQYYRSLIERGVEIKIENEPAQTILTKLREEYGKADRPDGTMEKVIDGILPLAANGLEIPQLVLRFQGREERIPVLSIGAFSDGSHMQHTLREGSRTANWVAIEPIARIIYKGENSFSQIGGIVSHEIDHAIFGFLFEDNIRRRYQQAVDLYEQGREFEEGGPVLTDDERDKRELRYEDYLFAKRIQQFEKLTTNMLFEGLARQIQQVFNHQQEAGLRRYIGDAAAPEEVDAFIRFPSEFEMVSRELDMDQLNYTLGDILVTGLMQEEPLHEFYLSSRYDQEIVQNFDILRQTIDRYLRVFDQSAAIYDRHAPLPTRKTRIIMEVYFKVWLEAHGISPEDFFLHERKKQLVEEAIRQVNKLDDDELSEFIESLRPEAPEGWFEITRPVLNNDRAFAKSLYAHVLKERALKVEWETRLGAIPTAAQLKAQREAAEQPVFEKSELRTSPAELTPADVTLREIMIEELQIFYAHGDHQFQFSDGEREQIRTYLDTYISYMFEGTLESKKRILDNYFQKLKTTFYTVQYFIAYIQELNRMIGIVREELGTENSPEAEAIVLNLIREHRNATLLAMISNLNRYGARRPKGEGTESITGFHDIVLESWRRGKGVLSSRQYAENGIILFSLGMRYFFESNAHLSGFKHTPFESIGALLAHPQISFNGKLFERKAARLAGDNLSGDFGEGKNVIFQIELEDPGTGVTQKILVKPGVWHPEFDEVVTEVTRQFEGLKTYHVEVLNPKTGQVVPGKEASIQDLQLIEMVPADMLYFQELQQGKDGLVSLKPLERRNAEKLHRLTDMEKPDKLRALEELGGHLAVEYLLGERDSLMKHVLFSKDGHFIKIDHEYPFEYGDQPWHPFIPGTLQSTSDYWGFLNELKKGDRLEGWDMERAVARGFNRVLAEFRDNTNGVRDRVLKVIGERVNFEKLKLPVIDRARLYQGEIKTIESLARQMDLRATHSYDMLAGIAQSQRAELRATSDFTLNTGVQVHISTGSLTRHPLFDRADNDRDRLIAARQHVQRFLNGFSKIKLESFARNQTSKSIKGTTIHFFQRGGYIHFDIQGIEGIIYQAIRPELRTADLADRFLELYQEAPDEFQSRIAESQEFNDVDFDQTLTVLALLRERFDQIDEPQQRSILQGAANILVRLVAQNVGIEAHDLSDQSPVFHKWDSVRLRQRFETARRQFNRLQEMNAGDFIQLEGLHRLGYVFEDTAEKISAIEEAARRSPNAIQTAGKATPLQWAGIIFNRLRRLYRFKNAGFIEAQRTLINPGEVFTAGDEQFYVFSIARDHPEIQIVRLNGPQRGTVYAVHEWAWFGRASDMDFVLSDSAAAERQAVIFSRGEGEWAFEQISPAPALQKSELRAKTAWREAAGVFDGLIEYLAESDREGTSIGIYEFSEKGLAGARNAVERSGLQLAYLMNPETDEIILFVPKIESGAVIAEKIVLNEQTVVNPATFKRQIVLYEVRLIAGHITSHIAQLLGLLAFNLLVAIPFVVALFDMLFYLANLNHHIPPVISGATLILYGVLAFAHLPVWKKKMNLLMVRSVPPKTSLQKPVASQQQPAEEARLLSPILQTDSIEMSVISKPPAAGLGDLDYAGIVKEIAQQARGSLFIESERGRTERQSHRITEFLAITGISTVFIAWAVPALWKAAVENALLPALTTTALVMPLILVLAGWNPLSAIKNYFQNQSSSTKQKSELRSFLGLSFKSPLPEDMLLVQVVPQGLAFVETGELVYKNRELAKWLSDQGIEYLMGSGLTQAKARGNLLNLLKARPDSNLEVLYEARIYPIRLGANKQDPDLIAQAEELLEPILSPYGLKSFKDRYPQVASAFVGVLADVLDKARHVYPSASEKPAGYSYEQFANSFSLHNLSNQFSNNDRPHFKILLLLAQWNDAMDEVLESAGGDYQAIESILDRGDNFLNLTYYRSQEVRAYSLRRLLDLWHQMEPQTALVFFRWGLEVIEKNTHWIPEDEQIDQSIEIVDRNLTENTMLSELVSILSDPTIRFAGREYQRGRVTGLAQDMEVAEFEGQNPVFKVQLLDRETGTEAGHLLFKYTERSDIVNERIATSVAAGFQLQSYSTENYPEPNEQAPSVWQMIEFRPSQMVAYTSSRYRFITENLANFLDERSGAEQRLRDMGAFFALEYVLGARDSKMKHFLWDRQTQRVFRIDWAEHLLDFESPENYNIPSVLKGDERDFLEAVLQSGDRGPQFFEHIVEGFNHFLDQIRQDIHPPQNSRLFQILRDSISDDDFQKASTHIRQQLSQANAAIRSRLGLGLDDDGNLLPPRSEIRPAIPERNYENPLSLRAESGRLNKVNRFLAGFLKDKWTAKKTIRVTDVGVGYAPFAVSELAYALNENFPDKKLKITAIDHQEVKKVVIFDQQKAYLDMYQREFFYTGLLLNEQNQIVGALSGENRDYLTDALDIWPEIRSQMEIDLYRALSGDDGYTIEKDPWPRFIQEQGLQDTVKIVPQTDYRHLPVELQGQADLIRVFDVAGKIDLEALALGLADGGYIVAGYTPSRVDEPIEKFVIYQKRFGQLLPVQYVFSTTLDRNQGPDWIDRQEWGQFHSAANAWQYSKDLNRDFLDSALMREVLFQAWTDLFNDPAFTEPYQAQIKYWQNRLDPLIEASIAESQSIRAHSYVGLDDLNQYIVEIHSFPDYMKKYNYHTVYNLLSKFFSYAALMTSLGLWVRAVLDALLWPAHALWTIFKVMPVINAYHAFYQDQYENIHRLWIERALKGFSDRQEDLGGSEITFDSTSGYLVVTPGNGQSTGPSRRVRKSELRTQEPERTETRTLESIIREKTGLTEQSPIDLSERPAPETIVDIIQTAFRERAHLLMDVQLMDWLLGISIPEGQMQYYTPYETIFQVLERLGLKEGDVLFDLGSGYGRLVLITGILFGDRGVRAVGIEENQDLFDSNVQSRDDLNLDPEIVTLRQGNYLSMMDSLSGEETLDLKLFEQATVFYLYDITGKTYIDDPLRRNISKLVGSLRFFADLRGLTGKPLPRLVDVGPTLTVNARPHSLDGELKKISDLGQNIIFYEVLPLSARSGKRSQDGQSTPSGKSELRPATETQTPIAAGIEKWIEFLRVKLPYLFSQGGKEAVSYVDFGSGTGGFIGEINELFEASGFFVRNGIGIEYSDVAARAAALSGFNVIEGDVTKYRELSRSYRELQEGASDIVFMNAPDFIRMDDEEILEWYEAAQFFLKPGGIILMRLYNYSHVDDETERLKRQRAETELFRGFFERHTDRINYELVPAGERPVLPRGHHQLREDLYVIRLNPQPSQETPVQPESEAQKVKPELRISAGETVEAAAGLIPGDLRSDLREALPELAAASPEKTAHVTFMRVSQNGIAPTMEEYRAAATNAIAQILTDQARSETTVLETIHANNLFLRDGLTRVLQHYFSTQTPDQKASFVMDVAEGTSLQTVSPLLKATLMGRAHLIDGLFLSSLDASRGSSLLSRVFSLVRGLGFNNVTMDRSLDSAKWERESHEGPMAVVTLNQPSVKAPIPEGFTLVTHSEDDSLAFEALSGEEQEALILLKQFEAIALWLGTTAAELLKDDPALFQFFQYHTNKNGLISFDLVRFHTEMRTAREFQTAA